MMTKVIRPLRFILVFLIIAAFLTHMSLIYLVKRGRWRQMTTASRALMTHSRWMLWALGVSVEFEGHINSPVQGVLLVGNHVSYVDIVVLSSLLPCCFVTSTDVRDMPGLGLICRMSGCLFVDRGSRRNMHLEVRELSHALEHDLNVAIYPEATSTNGEEVLRFRSPLFVSVIEAGRPVLPFALNYTHVGSKPLDSTNRDLIFWYGDMDFIPHLWKLTGAGGVRAKITFIPPIASGGLDAKALAAKTHEKVSQAFHPILPPISYT